MNDKIVELWNKMVNSIKDFFEYISEIIKNAIEWYKTYVYIEYQKAYEQGYTDGYNAIVYEIKNESYMDGYTKGFQDGIDHQQSKEQ